MRIDSISTSRIAYRFSNKNFDKKKSVKSPSFSGRTWRLPNIKPIDFYAAISLYSYFKIGHYLDSSDDDVLFENKQIRQDNLSFLDELKSKEDKQRFIEHYKDLTGFPNLKKVSNKIEQEFIIGIKKSVAETYGTECIAAGYDETCSVGKRKAFPGSDLDKSFIILKGTTDNNLSHDYEIVNKFKSRLWENVDQRILSFNHDISFPSVYTDNQLFDLLNKIKSKTQYMKIDSERLVKLMDEEFVNLERASEYNLAVSKYFPVESNWGEITKEDVKNAGYMVESIRDGKWLIATCDGYKLKSMLSKNYEFYNYSNVAQMRAMKKAVSEGRENKSKILIRYDMEQKFNNWDIDKQYDFIKTLIKYSCEDNNNFGEYFTNDRNVKDAYKPLLNQLTQGNISIYNRPEFSRIENGLNMKYAEDKSVNLFQGYNESILWIDSNDFDAIRQVCRMINRIKQSDFFQKVEKIQCPAPNVPIDKFYPINFLTMDNKQIYERIL